MEVDGKECVGKTNMTVVVAPSDVEGKAVDATSDEAESLAMGDGIGKAMTFGEISIKC